MGILYIVWLTTPGNFSSENVVSLHRNFTWANIEQSKSIADSRNTFKNLFFYYDRYIYLLDKYSLKYLDELQILLIYQIAYIS